MRDINALIDDAKATGIWVFNEYKVEIHDIVANEEHIVVLEVHNARFKNDEVLDNSVSTAVYHLDDQRLVTEIWPLLDTAVWKKALRM